MCTLYRIILTRVIFNSNCKEIEYIIVSAASVPLHYIYVPGGIRHKNGGGGNVLIMVSASYKNILYKG